MSITLGKGGIAYGTVLTFVIVIGGGLITWGETRFTVEGNAQEIEAQVDRHANDIQNIEEGQENLEDDMNSVVTEQKLIRQEVEHIKSSQQRQEDLSEQILNILRDE